jgi:hypothetical protein
MPKVESSPKPRQQVSESEAAGTAPVSKQAPPPPGMGKFVDKTA